MIFVKLKIQLGKITRKKISLNFPIMKINLYYFYWSICLFIYYNINRNPIFNYLKEKIELMNHYKLFKQCIDYNKNIFSWDNL